jgi:hypothetical protein
MQDATILSSIARQYHASLAMLRKAIEVCPDELWFDGSYKNPFWHIAYHTLFYAHLYLQVTMDSFTPWPKHREGARQLGATPVEELVKLAYTKTELLEYCEFCSTEAAARLVETQLEAESGFYWLPFQKLELHLYNIRHIQHHTGQLAERLRVVSDIGLRWVGE